MERWPEQGAQVLLYNISEDERFRKIRRYLLQSGVSMRVVQAPDFLQSIGYLLELPGFLKNPSFNLSENFTDEMLVMNGFSSEDIDRFLHFFREQQLKPMALKAILTPRNAHWNSIQLHKELLKEYHAMSKKNRK